MKKTYQKRIFFRRGEGLWTRMDGAVSRLTGSTYNPLYHLGTLSIFLFIVLLATGIYLTVFYRPGSEVAFKTVQAMTDTWLGSLMRSVHRYASDALIVVILLHMFKMLLNERFWGSRWLAWVTGFILLAVSWLIGTMGYWLVWDKQAQWMTEYGINIVRGPVAQTFLEANIASRTYAFFVIVLFLHVFLGLLIVLGVLIHEIRLNRARFWSPRWLMILASLVLAGIALWQPVSSNLPADMNTTVGTVVLDGWYLGFMALVTRWGNLAVWGASLLVLAVWMAFPWLLKGDDDIGPAIIIKEDCIGCTLCAVECPFDAIQMVPRDDHPQYKMLAVMKPNLCTSCGICVGACPTSANQMPGMLSPSLESQLLQTIQSATATGSSPVVLLTCQRQEGLGSFNFLGKLERQSFIEVNPTLQSENNLENPDVLVGAFASGNPGSELPLVSTTLPCVGYIPPDWIARLQAGGARGVVVVSCPQDDCSSREGPYWLENRLKRNHALEQEGLHWIDIAPGDSRPVRSLLERLAKEGVQSKFSLPDFVRGLPNRTPAMLTGLVLLLAAFWASSLPVFPVQATPLDEGELRIVVVHQGNVMETISELPGFQATLPPGVSPEQLFSGEKFPVEVRLELDGGLAAEETFLPGGIRREEAIFGFTHLPVKPDIYQIELSIMDDGEAWRPLFSGEVEVKQGQVRTFTYIEKTDSFSLR